MQKIIAKKYHKRLEKPAKAGTRRDKEREERKERKERKKRKKTIKTKGRARTTADSNFSVVSLTSLDYLASLASVTSLASDTLLLGGFEEILQLRHALAQDDTEAYSVVADIQKQSGLPHMEQTAVVYSYNLKLLKRSHCEVTSDRSTLNCSLWLSSLTYAWEVESVSESVLEACLTLSSIRNCYESVLTTNKLNLP